MDTIVVAEDEEEVAVNQNVTTSGKCKKYD